MYAQPRNFMQLIIIIKVFINIMLYAINIIFIAVVVNNVFVLFGNDNQLSMISVFPAGIHDLSTPHGGAPVRSAVLINDYQVQRKIDWTHII